jgi:hypothetical protein
VGQKADVGQSFVLVKVGMFFGESLGEKMVK